MAPLRILVVDDSVVIRKILSETLSSDPDIEVVGTAGDGRIGLAKIAQLHPDLITLDVEMPVMDGLQALAEVRKLYASLPVIMFSTLTERGASATLDALSLGASDYVTKPSNTGSMSVAVERIKAELIPKIKALCARPAARPAMRPPLRPAPRMRPRFLALSKLWPLAPLQAVPTRLPRLFRDLRKTFRFLLWPSSTCLPSLRRCLPTGSQAAPAFPLKKAPPTSRSHPATRGSLPETFT
jgi:chemotaxis response regulator CheB